MYMQNGVLLKVFSSDIGSDGVLRVPASVNIIETGAIAGLDSLRVLDLHDGITDIKEYAVDSNKNLEKVCFGSGITASRIGLTLIFRNCKKINELQIPSSWPRVPLSYVGIESPVLNIIRKDKGMSYLAEKIGSDYYVMDSKKTIADVSLCAARRLVFDDTGLCGGKWGIINYNQDCFVAASVSEAVFKMRRHKIIQEFEKIIDGKNVISSHKQILKDALDETVSGIYKNGGKIKVSDKKELMGFQTEIDDCLLKLNDFYDKYKINYQIKELEKIDFKSLQKIIYPASQNQDFTKSVTRKIKSKSLTENDVYDLCANKKYSQNPGAFPYVFLSGTKKSLRGDLTKKLHEQFKNASVKLYKISPNEICDYKLILKDLSLEIKGLTNCDVSINYIGRGHFGRAFKIKVAGQEESFVYKTYLSDIPGSVFHTYSHDTEIQNSFLLSGKKYYGKIYFRKIATAGLSSQRGEKYLIYPYYSGKSERIPEDPFIKVKKTELFDLGHNGNRVGNTIIDMGCISTNKEYEKYPFLQKIINTILHRPWDDLAYVLKNYNGAQIKIATDFIRGKTIYLIDDSIINAKIYFLENKTARPEKTNRADLIR